MKRKAASGRGKQTTFKCKPGGMLFGISSGAKCGDSKLG
jgi:hypothetical protein